MHATSYAGFRQAVLDGFATYRRRHFAGRDALLEPGPQGALIFRPEAAHRNLFDPALYHDLAHRPRGLRSMTSSRALAISVFGTLARREDLGLLAEVPCADFLPLLPEAGQAWALDLQGERGVDLWLRGPDLRLTVAPCLLERNLGACPKARRGACAGPVCCPLVAQQIGWQGGGPADCPLHQLYVLAQPLRALAGDPAAGADSPRTLLLVCDARNPAFAPDSRLSGLLAELQQALPAPFVLRRITWQAIAAAMARSPWYSDLLGFLREKYGIDS